MSDTTIVLVPVGDVELWYAEAADATWRLPVHVEWKKDPANESLYGLVIPGVCFYESQALVMQALLGSHSFEERADRWLITSKNIQALLRKAPGIHAEFYYLWPDKTHAPIPSHHGQSVTLRPVRPLKTDSFVQFVAAQHGLPADVVSVVLTAVADVAPWWLVKYRRTIDLGFARLSAFPFRENWKEIVMFKRKQDKLLHALLSPTRAIRMSRLGAIRFPATLCSLHNIAVRGMAKKCRLDYTIEAMTTDDFESVVDVIEGDRLREGEYVQQHGKNVEHLYDSIIECLVHYARKTQAAWAAVRKGGVGGSDAFVPDKARRFQGVPLDDLPVDIVPAGDDFSVFAERNGAGHRVSVHPAPAEMPKVSAVPSPVDDVRERSGDGDMEEPRPGGTARVSVLDAGQGNGARQPVFSCGSTEVWCPPRMDRE